MKYMIVALALIFSSSLWATDCEPVPSTWRLGEPVSASVLPTPPDREGGAAPYHDAVKALKEALQPGEKIVPFNGFFGEHGLGFGGSGYALIRHGCVVKSVTLKVN